ncbi:hypothetical protein L596_016892 [Steinernema carpocapsae]|uniref:Uncharacterized protein n=1 Tax=Steinernema carpocapsae TaxID=34508 RepID=A0A4U5NL26_STECR|nr:hypothetical protein L596_016892 [Steinernema carpocapsae]
MPSFSRDELVEIRTLMDLAYTATKIWEERGQREWSFKSLESAVRRLQQNGGNVEISLSIRCPIFRPVYR